MNDFIRLSDIRKTYKVGDLEIHAVDGVSFDISRGEFALVAGASGAGKSTVLNLMGGMDHVTSGSLSVDGREVSGLDARQLTEYRRNDIGFVFQFYNLVPSLTARENVQLVTDISDNPLDPEEALALVGLSERSDHFPAQLSGGEQQRVSIARAIAKRPDVLLCDEPTGALDFRTGILVLDVIERVNRELGTTTAIITHNAPIAAIADRVITIADGSVLSEVRNATKARPADVRW